MSGTLERTTFTPEDLLALPEWPQVELVDGQLVEREMGAWSSYVGGNLFLLLGNCCSDHRLGWVLPPETSYQCFAHDPQRVRKPDGSFIRLGRITEEEVRSSGHLKVVPDLVAEVLSPNDTAYDTDRRLSDFLQAGTKLVWVVNPDVQTVKVYRADGQATVLQGDDELTGEDVMPEFRCQVRELFKPAE